MNFYFTPTPRDLGVMLAAFLLFIWSFTLNQYLDPYTLWKPGISLLFIPAGVKLLCVLLGGVPALVGLYFAGVYASWVLWNNTPTVSHLALALIAACFYGAAVFWVRHLLKIRHDLSNLRYWHILVFASITSLAHGWGLALAYFSQQVSTDNNLIGQTLGIALGDFLGCFVVVMLFNLLVRVVKTLRRHNNLGSQ